MVMLAKNWQTKLKVCRDFRMELHSVIAISALLSVYIGMVVLKLPFSSWNFWGQPF
jgi:hypothetical protein